jgi:protein SCO1/2
MTTLFALLMACWGDNAHIVEGTIVEVPSADQIVLDHDPIKSLGMDRMTMPFQVRDPEVLANLKPGQRVIARLEIDESGGHLAKIRVTGTRAVPEKLDLGPEPLRKGQQLPATVVTVEDGSQVTIGAGQDRRTILTFLYTTCPMPEFCPATVARLQAVQEVLPAGVRIVAVTIDPDTDTLPVLAKFAADSGADPAKWRFGRVDDLPALALYGGLTVTEAGEEIAHGIRVLALDAEGRLVRRFDDLKWSTEELLADLE